MSTRITTIHGNGELFQIILNYDILILMINGNQMSISKEQPRVYNNLELYRILSGALFQNAHTKGNLKKCVSEIGPNR